MTGKVWRAEDLGLALGCLVKGDVGREFDEVAPIEEAGERAIAFVANPKYRRFLESTRAGGVILKTDATTPERVVRFETPQPYLAFRKALDLFYPAYFPTVPEGIHPSAVIDPSAKIGSGARIGPFVQIEAGAVIGDRFQAFKGAYVGQGAVIGDGTTLGVNVVIRHYVRLGSRVIVGDGSVIGFDGFGYAPDEKGFHKIPQVGIVEISDDVEIGANSCIDRATVGATRIGRGTKLDNLIQIAHGVHIGAATVIAAQTGISGSTTVGSGVMIGGQAGFAGHIDVGDRMIVGAQAGVTKDWDVKGMIAGYPARPQREELRLEAARAQLPEMLKRIKALEQAILQAGSGE